MPDNNLKACHGKVTKKDLHYIEYLNREQGFHHSTYDEDMLQYNYMKTGDSRAIEESIKNFNPSIQGHLSDDSLRNIKYLFVASTTLCTRICMSNGLNHELAQNISDLYIQQMDLCQSVEQVKKLHTYMFESFTEQMAELQNKYICSQPVMKCIDYISYHLSEPIHLSDLAKHVQLHESYLSSLFKKETGKSAKDYILYKKIETACNILKYSDYSISQISAELAFSSQSHFTQVFKKHTGQTPQKYKQQHMHIDFNNHEPP